MDYYYYYLAKKVIDYNYYYFFQKVICNWLLITFQKCLYVLYKKGPLTKIGFSICLMHKTFENVLVPLFSHIELNLQQFRGLAEGPGNFSQFLGTFFGQFHGTFWDFEGKSNQRSNRTKSNENYSFF